jgi:hypothetical protein
MDNVIKPLGTEFALTTANTCANGTAIRLVNLGASPVLVSVNVVSQNVTSTFTLRADSEVTVKKTPLDTIAANSTVYAVPVGFF